MAGIVGDNILYDQVWAFLFEIEGVEVGRFMEAGPLKQSVGVAVQKQGGARTATNKATTTFSSEPITLKRGASDDDTLWQWWLNVKRGIQDRRNCTLVQLGPDGETRVKEYPITDAIMSSYTAGTWDRSKETENQTEECTLEYIDFDRKAA
jgi:phage tail-like protein